MSHSEHENDRQNLLSALEKQFIRLFRQFKNDLNKKLGGDITRHEFMFMKLLYKQEPKKMSSLACELDVTASHATAVVEKLAQKNWLERQRSSEDRRIIELRLTDKGEEMVQYMEEVRTEYLISVFKNLSDDEINVMHQLLEKLQ